jgi:hypothetical protein
MPIRADQILNDENFQPVALRLIEGPTDPDCPRTAYGLGMTIPEEMRRKTKKRAAKVIELMAELTGGEIPDELREEMDSVEMPEEGCIDTPILVCWN